MSFNMIILAFTQFLPALLALSFCWFWFLLPGELEFYLLLFCYVLRYSCFGPASIDGSDSSSAFISSLGFKHPQQRQTEIRMMTARSTRTNQNKHGASPMIQPDSPSTHFTPPQLTSLGWLLGAGAAEVDFAFYKLAKVSSDAYYLILTACA